MQPVTVKGQNLDNLGYGGLLTLVGFGGYGLNSDGYITGQGFGSPMMETESDLFLRSGR